MRFWTLASVIQYSDDKKDSHLDRGHIVYAGHETKYRAMRIQAAVPVWRNDCTCGCQGMLAAREGTEDCTRSQERIVIRCWRSSESPPPAADGRGFPLLLLLRNLGVVLWIGSFPASREALLPRKEGSKDQVGLEEQGSTDATAAPLSTPQTLVPG